MKRNLFAGRRRSGGLKLDVFTDDEIQDIHLATLEVLERTGVWVELDEALDIYSDGGCVVDRDVAHRAHPAAHRRGRRRQRAALRGDVRPRPEERHLPRAGPRGLQQLRRGHPGRRPATRGELRAVDEEGPRRDRPPRRRAPRSRRLRDGRRLQRPAAGVVLAAQPRGGDRQSDEADLRRARRTATPSTAPWTCSPPSRGAGTRCASGR